MIYIDTSVLVAYYCPEDTSQRAERMIRSVAFPAISDLTEVEFFSALSRKVRGGDLPRAQAEAIAAQFLAHLEANLYTRLAVERRHYLLARNLIGRFATPLRTLDGLQLAVAASEGVELVTSDKALFDSAGALGMKAVWVG